MNAPQIIGPIHGRLDAEGRLIEADPPLLRLHELAGGIGGGKLAVPQLASLARLTSRLRINISRRVVAAFGDQDVDLWVKVKPQADGVEMAITGWDKVAAAGPAPGHDGDRARDFGRASADWVCETDAMLRITVAPANMPGSIGEPFAALFALSSAGGVDAVAEAARAARRFDEDAVMQVGAGIPVRLSGVPLIDGLGALAGYHVMIIRTTAASRLALAPAIDAPPVVAPAADAARSDDDPLVRAMPGDAASGDAPTAQEENFGTQLSRAMRGPLDRIISHADSISGRDDGPLRRDYATYANDIAGAGRHLLALVEDLVDLQTIERPDFVPESEPIDLIDITRRAAGLLVVRASNSGISLDLSPPARPVTARGDFHRILQILINLITNAIRHSPEEGTVWIRCGREGDFAAIIVADSGDGIAPEHHEKVFERFERLGRADGTGSGLGLYISRRLARAMGGELAVDSAIGEGARFMLMLPLA